MFDGVVKAITAIGIVIFIIGVVVGACDRSCNYKITIVPTVEKIK